MTVDQVKLIKSAHEKAVAQADGTNKPLANKMKVIFDNNIQCNTQQDPILWDDTNRLVTFLSINEDPIAQSETPCKVFTSGYESVQFMEGYYAADKLVEGLDILCPGMTAAQRDRIDAWAKSIHNQAMQPPRPEPYYDTMVHGVTKPYKRIPRDDGVTKTEPVQHEVIVKACSAADAATMLANANDGDAITISSGVIDTPLTISKSTALILSKDVVVSADVTIDAVDASLSGGNYTGTITSTAEKLSITGAKITGSIVSKHPDTRVEIVGCVLSRVAEDTNTSSLINVDATGSTIVIDNTQVEVFNGMRNPILTRSSNVIITNCVFMGNKTAYNYIEASQKVPLEYFEVSGCTFNEACNHNAISIFVFEEGAIVNIEKNYFTIADNAMRVSNYTNVPNVNINITDNEYWNVGPIVEYIGFILFQGFKGEDFSTMNVYIKNLVGPKGAIANFNGTGDRQVYYTYNTDTTPNVVFL